MIDKLTAVLVLKIPKEIYEDKELIDFTDEDLRVRLKNNLAVDLDLPAEDKNIELYEVYMGRVLPKFEIGKRLYYIHNNNVLTFTPVAIVKMEDTEFVYCGDTHFYWQVPESRLFATREEAEEQLQGEQDGQKV